MLLRFSEFIMLSSYRRVFIVNWIKIGIKNVIIRPSRTRLDVFSSRVGEGRLVGRGGLTNVQSMVDQGRPVSRQM